MDVSRALQHTRIGTENQGVPSSTLGLGTILTVVDGIIQPSILFCSPFAFEQMFISSAKEIYDQIKDSADQETVDGAAELVNNLATRLLIYVDALGAHEMDLPFFGSITTVEYSADC